MDKKMLAKRVTIESLYPYMDSVKSFNNKLRGRCPFHPDNTNPNFFIYQETNTWYCFAGCGGGDSISFYMKLKNVDFKKAINALGRRG